MWAIYFWLRSHFAFADIHAAKCSRVRLFRRCMVGGLQSPRRFLWTRASMFMLVRGGEPKITSCTTIMILLLAAQNKSTCRIAQKSAFLDKLMHLVILSSLWIKKSDQVFLYRHYHLHLLHSRHRFIFFGRFAAQKLFLLRILGIFASWMPSICMQHEETHEMNT